MTSRASRASCVAAVMLLLMAMAAPDAQQRFIPGLFVSGPDGPVELIAYAEPVPDRRLRMIEGSLEDAPTVQPRATLRILCSIPLWQPAGLTIASEEIFRKDNSEMRSIPFATRALNVSTRELRSSDLERPERVARLLKNVKASESNPGLLFIVLSSGGMVRYYPVRLEIPAPH